MQDKVSRINGRIMLTKVEMKLNAKIDQISYQMSSSFHGALMELLPEQYADELHVSQVHPYSQHIERKNEAWYWVVATLNETAASKIIKDALLPINEITLKSHNLTIQIVEKNYLEISDTELAYNFYQEKSSPYVSIQFVTPTAFKQNGRYVNYPDLRMIFMSLMNRYGSANNENAYDEDTLEQLTKKIYLSRYDLRSTFFALEGVRIPAFIGKITLKVGGAQVMSNFVGMLLTFGSYSGIGIKTSLGMGAIRILEEENRKNGK